MANEPDTIVIVTVFLPAPVISNTLPTATRRGARTFRDPQHAGE